MSLYNAKLLFLVDEGLKHPLKIKLITAENFTFIFKSLTGYCPVILFERSL
jgi:hypothetical protein